MKEIIAVAVSIAIALLAVLYLTPRIASLYRQAGIMRKNYIGREITPSLGPIISLSWIPALVWLSFWSAGGTPSDAGAGRTVFPLAVLMLGLTAVGLLDDVLNESTRGYRGHFLSLKEGRLTMGMLKALWGAALAVLVVLNFDFPGVNLPAGSAAASLPVVLLSKAAAILTILFWTNGLNFLDRRPGRALKVFLFLGLAISFRGLAGYRSAAQVWASASGLSGEGYPGPLILMLPLLVIVLTLLSADLGGGAMLGDAGANPLGAVLGLYGLLMLPFWGRLLFLLLGLMLNLAGERVSLSAVIDQNRFLSFLDRLGYHTKK